MKKVYIKIRNIIIYCFWKSIYFILLFFGQYKTINKEKILVISIKLIGDAVMVSPIFKNLVKYNNIDCVDVLCSNLEKDVFEHCRYVKNILVINSFEEFIKSKNIKCFSRGIYRLWYCMYIFKYTYNNIRNKYSIIIVPRWHMDLMFISIISLISGVKHRYAYSENTSKEKKIKRYFQDHYFTTVYNHGAACHESEKFLDLIKMIGYKVEDKNIALTHKTTNKIPSGIKYAVLALDTSNNKKEWDINNFLKISDFLEKCGLWIVLLGVKKAYGEYYERNTNCIKYINLIGKTTVSEAIDIIADSEIYIGCDTGLSHIAAAVDVKGIVIFSNSKFEEPWQPSSVTRMRPKSNNIIVVQPDLPLAPCKTICISEYAHCVNLVEPENIIEIIKKLLIKGGLK